MRQNLVIDSEEDLNNLSKMKEVGIALAASFMGGLSNQSGTVVIKNINININYAKGGGATISVNEGKAK